MGPRFSETPIWSPQKTLNELDFAQCSKGFETGDLVAQNVSHRNTTEHQIPTPPNTSTIEALEYQFSLATVVI